MNNSVQKRSLSGGFGLKAIGALLVMFVIAVIFWDTLLIYPIKLFVVVLHEFSHGLAAILSGGKIIKIEISQHVGGFCMHAGGNRLFVASAGYLGSIFWGGVILLAATKTRYDNILGVAIGGLLILLASLYVRNLFGLLFTIGFGAALIVASLTVGNKAIDVLLKFLGMTSCLYVIVDIKSDLIDRSNIGSDADVIAEILGFPGFSIVIGIVWILIALVSLVFFLWVSGRGSAD